MLSLDDVEFWADVPEDVLPEIRLWADVLFFGLYDAACYHGTKVGDMKPASGDNRKARSQAWWWLHDDAKCDVGSFFWCCRLFNVDPHRTREGVKSRWKDIVMGQLKFSNKTNKDNSNGH